jgi:hypothetical protein
MKQLAIQALSNGSTMHAHYQHARYVTPTVKLFSEAHAAHTSVNALHAIDGL